MIGSSEHLLAATRVKYEFVRLGSLTDWWHWLALLGVCVAIIFYVVVLYRRDSVELRRSVRWMLLLLRIFTITALLFVFLDLEKRTEREVVVNSRVVLLVDTSQSMGLQDNDSSVRRIGEVIDTLAQGKLLTELRTQHDVKVLRFDHNRRPTEVATFVKTAVASPETENVQSADTQLRASLNEARVLASIGGGLLLLAMIAAIVHLLLRRRMATDATAWPVLILMLALIFAFVTFAVSNLRNPQIDLLTLLGQKDLSQSGQSKDANDSRSETIPDDAIVAWPEVLLPDGTETRLGDALIDVVNRERGGPIAAIVVASDGRENAGASYTDAVELAQDAGIIVHTIGLGTDRRSRNARVVDIEAPSRIYPGDRFTITGFIQADAMQGTSTKIELYSSETKRQTLSEDPATPETLEDELTLQFPADGEVVPVKFQVTPSQQGRRTYRVKISANTPDRNPRDDSRTTQVEIVARRNRVLLFAGGPTREFRFLRNQLYRDIETSVDVLLQTALPGIAQDADNILFDFPKNEAELFGTDVNSGGKQQGYDCIIAFDPDWRQLSDTQVQLLERWVAEQAGGLIVISGPVFTPTWAPTRAGNLNIDTIKALYPVRFFSRGTSIGLERFGSEKPSRLRFSREVLSADFLNLDDGGSADSVWSEFEGVYGYYAVRDIKPGATVYARLDDEHAVTEEEMPVYIAGQFYGAGRVMFLASGEIWRLRGVDDTYFEKFYTKLIRYVSQGRLMRDSSRGLLMVSKQRGLIGDSIAVRTHLLDAQHQPLTADEIQASLVLPEGRRVPLIMRQVKDAAREGMYAGLFTATQVGDYRIELSVPGASDEVLLTKQVQINVPEKEMQQSTRNNPLLTDLAERTGGKYYLGMNSVIGTSGSPLAASIEPQDRPTPLPDLPDKVFERRLMNWLLAAICGALSLEWLVRRINKLA